MTQRESPSLRDVDDRRRRPRSTSIVDVDDARARARRLAVRRSPVRRSPFATGDRRRSTGEPTRDHHVARGHHVARVDAIDRLVLREPNRRARSVAAFVRTAPRVVARDDRRRPSTPSVDDGRRRAGRRPSTTHHPLRRWRTRSTIESLRRARACATSMAADEEEDVVTSS